MLGWVLNLIYVVLIAAVSPLLLVRSLVTGKYRRGWAEKLCGRVPAVSPAEPRSEGAAGGSAKSEIGDPRPVWLHAVSVGEVLQLRGLAAEFVRRFPDVPLVISTTTDTGYAMARQHFGQHIVCYAPLDFTWAIRRALRRLRPRAIVLVELELWPNWIREADRAGVPIGVVNGRLSLRSFRGYRRLRWFFRPLLRRLACVAVQTDEYAKRFAELGVPDANLRVTGSIKYDHVQTDRRNPQTEKLRAMFGISPGEIVWVAGSTHAPEERTVLDVFARVRKDRPELRLIVVPRHPERFDEVARLICASGFSLLRRSELREPASDSSDCASASKAVSGACDSERQSAEGICGPSDLAVVSGAVESSTVSCAGGRALASGAAPPVVLLDTIGELGACWGLADIAFVGGSLTQRGGQNMIEPAGYGAAVCFGPNTFNFRDTVDALLERDAAKVVRSADELEQTLRLWLADPEQRKAVGRRAQQFVTAQAGAIARTVDVLAELLGERPADKSN